MDASKLGTKVKVDGKNQRTVLSPTDIAKIIDTFNTSKVENDFCVTVSYSDIETKKYSFSAGQYFEVEIEYIDISSKQFADKIENYNSILKNLFAEGCRLEAEILEQIGRVKNED